LGIGLQAPDGKASQPVIEILNKADRLSRDERDTVINHVARDTDQILVSALDGEGCDRLLQRLDALLAAAREVVDVTVGLADGAALAWLYRHGEVLKRKDDEDGAHLTVSLDPADRARFEHRQASQD
jgi:GTP-binding protein HflX